MNRARLFLLPFFLSSGALFAGSLRLVNDSSFKLRVMVRGADGTYLGEMVLNPEHSGNWSDTHGQVGSFGKGNLRGENATRSQTPYTVLWYCLDGEAYSYTDLVATGGLVTARGGTGAHMCRARHKKMGPYPQQPEGQYLHPEEESPEPTPRTPTPNQ
jgi:hypothetical protein